MKKIQFYSLRIFLALMFLTAGMFLSIIWKGGPDSFGIINRLTFTSFVIGLASFLIWITTVIIEVKNKIDKK